MKFSSTLGCDPQKEYLSVEKRQETFRTQPCGQILSAMGGYFTMTDPDSGLPLWIIHYISPPSATGLSDALVEQCQRLMHPVLHSICFISALEERIDDIHRDIDTLFYTSPLRHEGAEKQFKSLLSEAKKFATEEERMRWYTETVFLPEYFKMKCAAQQLCQEKPVSFELFQAMFEILETDWLVKSGINLSLLEQREREAYRHSLTLHLNEQTELAINQHNAHYPVFDKIHKTLLENAIRLLAKIVDGGLHESSQVPLVVELLITSANTEPGNLRYNNRDFDSGSLQLFARAIRDTEQLRTENPFDALTAIKKMYLNFSGLCHQLCSFVEGEPNHYWYEIAKLLRAFGGHPVSAEKVIRQAMQLPSDEKLSELASLNFYHLVDNIFDFYCEHSRNPSLFDNMFRLFARKSEDDAVKMAAQGHECCERLLKIIFQYDANAFSTQLYSDEIEALRSNMSSIRKSFAIDDACVTTLTRGIDYATQYEATLTHLSAAPPSDSRNTL